MSLPRGALPVLAAALILPGCHKNPASTRKGHSAEALFPIPREIEYIEHIQRGESLVSHQRVRETWTLLRDEDPPVGFSGRVYEVAVADLHDGREGEPSRARVVMGPEGYAHFMTETEAGAQRYKAKTELPGRVRFRSRWEGEHGENARQSSRSCKVERTPFCRRDGIATVCLTEYADGGTVWMRQHWCPGPGWVGSEAVINRDGTAMRTWTSDVVVDGHVVSDIAMTERRTPRLKRVPWREPELHEILVREKAVSTR